MYFIGRYKVRIIDGPSTGQGRVEVRYNNQWGSFCFDKWNNTSADVICKMLQYK